MLKQIKTTAPNTPVGAGAEQPQIKNNDIIPQFTKNSNTHTNIFSEVKLGVGIKAAAERYGLVISNGGMVNCIFHSDHHPSMKLYDDHYHCFACNAHGDVIAFAAQLFGCKPIEAAKRLAEDFGIDYGSGMSAKVQSPKKVITENDVYKLINEYVNLLKKHKTDYAPQTPDEELHPYYMQAVHELPVYENCLDTLLSGTDDERQELLDLKG